MDKHIILPPMIPFGMVEDMQPQCLSTWCVPVQMDKNMNSTSQTRVHSQVDEVLPKREFIMGNWWEAHAITVNGPDLHRVSKTCMVSVQERSGSRKRPLLSAASTSSLRYLCNKRSFNNDDRSRSLPASQATRIELRCPFGTCSSKAASLQHCTNALWMLSRGARLSISVLR